MTEHTLIAHLRAGSGKGSARAARREEMVPAVIYGSGKEPKTIKLHFHKLKNLINKGDFYTTILTLDVDGNKEKVLPRDVQVHPVMGHPIHADFLRFDPKSDIKVMVTVHVVGEEDSPGAKIGGVVQLVRPEVELLCKADNIPHSVEISVAGTNIGDSVHLSSIKLPKGVKPASERDITVATIVSTRSSLKADADADQATAANAASASEEATAEATSEE